MMGNARVALLLINGFTSRTCKRAVPYVAAGLNARTRGSSIEPSHSGGTSLSCSLDPSDAHERNGSCGCWLCALGLPFVLLAQGGPDCNTERNGTDDLSASPLVSGQSVPRMRRGGLATRSRPEQYSHIPGCSPRRSIPSIHPLEALSCAA